MWNVYSPDTQCLSWLVPLDWKATTNMTKNSALTTMDTTNAWGQIDTIISTTNEPEVIAEVLLDMLLLDLV